MTASGPVEKWRTEYKAGGIPSSTRETPSGPVEWAVGELKRRGYPLREAADIGCGKGRNSIYLAQQGLHVTAMDFTPDAISHLSEKARTLGLADKIRPIVQDVTEPWPMAPASVDLAVDVFCFKHISIKEARDSYKESLLRVLRARGHYLISFASIGDGYYGRYIKAPVADPADAEEVIVDPVNGIESVLYGPKTVKRFFGPELDLLAEIQHNVPSEMHGETYQRSTYAMLFQHNPLSFA